ncbi:MAG: Gfo/Idh/MocA family protein [Planctomycetota bacterium]|jgi:predicted dehydrogenase
MVPSSTKSELCTHTETYSRRQLLKTTIARLAVLTSVGKVLGANDDIRVAVIGLGNKGKGHVKQFRNIPGVRIVALCDVDPRRLADQVKLFDNVFSNTDPRRILDRKDIDAVVIATPDHWHALLAIWACQSGRDVYVEKPVSHNILEGRKMIQAAKKYGRIMQAGTQYRSDEGLAQAVEYVQSGKLGKILRAHVPWYEYRPGIGRVAAYTPDWLDYDLYCGPGELKPLRRKKLHYDWHWLWNTGTGDLGNSGIHAFDFCRWMMGYQTLPPRVICVGGRFGVDDVAETPNTQLTLLDYDDAPIVIEDRNLGDKKDSRNLDHVLGVREGVIVYCEGGYFAGLRAGGWVYDNDGKKIKQFVGGGGGNHAANFIEAVRRRDASILKAPIEEGHISSACCHLGNISYRLGSPATSDRINAAFKNSDLAGRIFDSIAEHLKANEVDLHQSPLTLGPRLTIDVASEKIISVTESKESITTAEANRLVRGSYRHPFIIPKTV